MKPSRPLLWVFLLPTLVVLIPALLFGFGAVQVLKERVSQNHASQLQDLSALQQAADYKQSLAELHKDVVDMLQQADRGELTPLASYRLHSSFVNELATLGGQVQALTETPLMVDLNHGSAQQLREAFEAYRSFIIMASDIATIDPTQARHYLDEAQQAFLRFAMLTGRLSSKLSQRTSDRTEDSYQAILGHLGTVTLLGGLTLLLMLLAAFYSARYSIVICWPSAKPCSALPACAERYLNCHASSVWQSAAGARCDRLPVRCCDCAKARHDASSPSARPTS
ncbi:hypothetical protein [Halomonas sp. BC04]|uniref:hypothetical protein n=1 Tax=Halomonas sp. BC04 TaxID=1403540 RepID=UPI0003ED5FF1|nr:hypothetical protein [Halomonas sp. BC04]EWH01904.1 hypothetical protein Q427_11635 [Halomonas sp. BC04]